MFGLVGLPTMPHVTVLAPVLLAVAALVVGGGVGLLLGLRSRRAGRFRSRAGGTDRPRDRRDVPTLAELLQRVFRSAGSGTAVLAPSGDVVLANARATELGVVRDGRPDPRAWAACQQVLADGSPCEVDLSPLEYRARRPTAVVATVRPLGDGFTVVEAADTSEVVRLEATRRDFVANVSHELKTPVGALTLLAEAVQDAADDPTAVRRFAGRMQHEGNRLARLVAELIELSRLQGADPLPAATEVPVDRIVAEALDRTRLGSDKAGIAVVSGGDRGLSVRGSEPQLITALSNLVDNAVAYSPAGTRVAVGTRRREGHVEISVSDQGIGIAERDLERVFERFYRADPARSRATGGTGLGLAIVKHVASNHGGAVSVWSEEGLGSTFTLRIPLDAATTVAVDASKGRS